MKHFCLFSVFVGVVLGAGAGAWLGYRSGYRGGVAATIEMYDIFSSSIDTSHYREEVQKFKHTDQILEMLK
jgi:hypothetical protein